MKYIVTFFIYWCITLNLFAQNPMLKFRSPSTIKNWEFYKGVKYGAWQKNFETIGWTKVKVPHTYSMDAINDIGYYKGESWYRTKIKFDSLIINNKTFLRFEGVGHRSEVFVNGQKAGKHLGGYSAFVINLTPYLVKGENTIAVKVSNKEYNRMIPIDDHLFNLYGGIYRPVQIFTTPTSHFETEYYASSGVFITTDLKNNKAEVSIESYINTNKLEQFNLLLRT